MADADQVPASLCGKVVWYKPDPEVEVFWPFQVPFHDFLFLLLLTLDIFCFIAGQEGIQTRFEFVEFQQGFGPCVSFSFRVDSRARIFTRSRLIFSSIASFVNFFLTQ